MKLTKWIDDTENMTWQAAMRFSIVVLSALLFGMHYGQSLPREIGGFCYLFALSGMAFYFSLELVADQRAQKRARTSQHATEQRLSRCLRCEDKMISYHEADESGEQPSGRVESAMDKSAMDSCADLAMYLGPTAQPVLSA